MKKLLFKRMLLGFLATMLIGSATAKESHAIAMLQLEDLTTLDVVTITDGGGGDVNPLAGGVTFIGGLGGTSNFIVNITTGLSVPIIGTATAPQMDLLSVNVSGGTGTLAIRFSDNDFPALDAGITGFQTNVGGTTFGSAITLRSFYDTSNLHFGQGTQMASLGSYSGGAFSGGVSSLSVPSSNPYSLTMEAIISHNGAGSMTSFDAHLVPTPEPGTFILMGSGLVGLGFWRWRRPKNG